MKRGLHWFSVLIGVIGALFALFNVWHAATGPRTDEIQELLRFLRYAVAAAQIAPIAGFWFGREAIAGVEAKTWNKQRRAGFILWVTVSVPMLLLGAASVALTLTLG